MKNVNLIDCVPQRNGISLPDRWSVNIFINVEQKRISQRKRNEKQYFLFYLDWNTSSELKNIEWMNVSCIEWERSSIDNDECFKMSFWVEAAKAAPAINFLVTSIYVWYDTQYTHWTVSKMMTFRLRLSYWMSPEKVTK